MTSWIRCLALSALLGLGACSEPAQTATARRVDDKPWVGPATAFTAAGWTPGDRAAWEQQMRQRSQGQNDYLRMPAKP